jgi:hypothetical protein
MDKNMSQNFESGEKESTEELKGKFKNEYIDNPPCKNFETEDDFKKVFEAPIATFDEINSFMGSLTKDDKEDLKKLVAIGMEQLLSVNKGNESFIERFKRFEIPQDLRQLKDIVKFLLEKGVTFAKQIPKQNLVRLLDETAAPNLKHLSMFSKYIFQKAPKDRNFDDLMNTTIKYLPQCYDIMSLDINDSDLFLSMTVFLKKQLENFTTDIGSIGFQSDILWGGFNFYLDEKLKKFVSANPAINQDKLKELVQFRGKLRLFQKQFPQYETTIKEILEITRIFPDMNFDEITGKLSKISNPKMLADLKGFQINSLLDSSFETELYETLVDQSTKLADSAFNSPPPAGAGVKEICDRLFLIVVSGDYENLIDEKHLDQLLALLAEPNPSSDEKEQKISQFLAQDEFKKLLDYLLKAEPLKILTDAKGIVFSKIGIDVKLFYEIQNLKTNLAHYQPKEEEKEAIETLKNFFDDGDLEKRIFGLPTFLEHNPDILKNLSPSPVMKCLHNVLLAISNFINRMFLNVFSNVTSIDEGLTAISRQLEKIDPKVSPQRDEIASEQDDSSRHSAP